MTECQLEHKAEKIKLGTNKQKEILLSALRQIWPHSFGSYVPLKIGVKSDLLDELPEADERIISIALLTHCRSFKYQRALSSENSARHDLDGVPVEPVSDAHRDSARRLLSKRAKRK